MYPNFSYHVLPSINNLKETTPPTTFNCKSWFKTNHFINSSPDNNDKSICITKNREYTKDRIIKCKKIKEKVVI